MRDLINLGLWNDNMKNRLIAANGSVQNLPGVPQNIKDIYKTVWEISQRTIIDMAAERGAYICQSQSMNVFMQDPNFGKLTSMHFYAWKKGLKAGMYYLRSQAATSAIQFTVDKSALEPEKKAATPQALDMSKSVKQDAIACSLDDPDGCEMCGS